MVAHVSNNKEKRKQLVRNSRSSRDVMGLGCDAPRMLHVALDKGVCWIASTASMITIVDCLKV